MEKSFVTIEICPICKGETQRLLFDRRLKQRFSINTINPINVCDNCREQYLSKGVMLINPETCSLIVVTNESFEKIFGKSIPKGKICFAKEEVIEEIRIESGVE